MFSHFQARVGRTAVFQLLALALHGSRLIENMRQSIHVPIQSKRQTNDVRHDTRHRAIQRRTGGQGRFVRGLVRGAFVTLDVHCVGHVPVRWQHSSRCRASMCSNGVDTRFESSVAPTLKFPRPPPRSHGACLSWHHLADRPLRYFADLRTQPVMHRAYIITVPIGIVSSACG